MKQVLIAFLAGYVLDLIIGDPHNLWHPVCGIGKLIQKSEKWLRKTMGNEKLAGVFLVVIVCCISTGIPYGILILSNLIHPYVKTFVMAIMCCQLLATKSLKDESMKVYKKLAEDDLEGSRTAVSMIVGRDTKNLTKEGVTKATVETIAENTSDGIIAPMFYILLGGPVAGFFYKAVNTMDSMVGYKNEKYMNFGWAAAKFDDIVNFLPARIAAVLMIFASGVLGYDMKNAGKIYIRDRFNHASPNSAQTEAVMAGALEVQLAGDAYYFGKLYKKKTIGDHKKDIMPEDIKRANKLLYLTSLFAVIVITIIEVCVML